MTLFPPPTLRNQIYQTMGIEKLTTLAFSMYSNKGAYALLLGSGISRSSGIPSGWDVEERLIQMLGESQGVTEQEDWHQWYRERYGEPASYSSLLGALATTSTERVQLMRPFFEPTEEERELGRKEPTKAHRAIAQLAKEGYIRVILTTNFDRLLEKALEAEGVTPQVISHEGAIAQATPLVHSDRPTIVKINGDYIDCKFRNTTEELDEYPEEMKHYLQRVFEDYGLVTCGWSGDWDKGLIRIMEGAPHPRYSSFFTSVGEPGTGLKSLSLSREGETMKIKGADELFSELSEQVVALKGLAVRANMSQEMRIARVKKYLSSEQHAIDFADMIEQWGAEAYKQISEVAHYDFELTREAFDRYLKIHLSAVTPLLEAAVLTVRWGKEWQIKLIGDILAKLCAKRLETERQEVRETKYLHGLAPMLLFNVLGLLCVKYERFKELDAILNRVVLGGSFIRPYYSDPLLALLGCTYWKSDTWNSLTGMSYRFPASHFYLRCLRSLCRSCFVTDSEYEGFFYIWEHLRSLMFRYSECPAIGLWPTSGYFLLAREDYRGSFREQEPYRLFFEGAKKQRNDWMPIKQGMFGGNYDEYEKIYDELEKSYVASEAIWHRG